MNDDEADTSQVVGQLEDEARKRKERLRLLKLKLEGREEEVESEKKETSLPKPTFRSYNPTSFDPAPTAAPIDIEPQVADTLAQGEVKGLMDEVELTSLAPRKPDWDLKRDVAGKLEKLERRTQRAIAELIVERLRTSDN